MLKKMKMISALFMMSSLQLYSAELTVSKIDAAQFTTIQAAVNAAIDGDEILIIDSAVYEERVVIESRNNLVLRSKFNNDYYGGKPIIKWQDKESVGPRTAAEALIEDKITYYKNGALLINNCKNILVSGIIVDGVEPYAFGYTGIWNGKDPLFHGNTAVTILKSGNVTIRYCDFSNSYFGIYIKDMNEGGIYANSNPSDLIIKQVDFLSGFNKTGNHIFEYNRIHNNSWGMFFESSWNHGSVIRYNRIFENHHANAGVITKIKMMPDGINQPSGAMFFKDDVCSPLVIYNNTFYHNLLIFAGHWRPGAQHLIFNNIFGTPSTYWGSQDGVNTYMDFSHLFVNRMHNCLLACQQQAPDNQTQQYIAAIPDPGTGELVSETATVTFPANARITNDISYVKREGVIFPITIKLSTGDTVIYKNAEFAIKEGAPVYKPFPESANIRWYEMKFKSTDPASSDFLVPNDDTLTARLVKNAGWVESGIYNKDGRIADIGAPALSENIPCVKNIVPLEPLFINIDSDSKKAAILSSFKLESSDLFPNPHLEYMRFLNDLPFEADGFGSSIDSIRNKNIISISNDFTLRSGINIIEENIDLADQNLGNYGFLELTVSSGGESGFKSAVGFIPYRKMSNSIRVELKNISNPSETEINKGGFALINITCDSVKRIGNVNLRLLSGEKILNPDGSEFIFNPVSGTLTYQDTVMFNHTGDDAIVFSAVDSSASGLVYILSCSKKFTVQGTEAVIHKKLISNLKTADSKFALFSLNGRKAGCFNANQLNSMQASKIRLVPSGIYFAVSQAEADRVRPNGRSVKIVIP